MDENFTIKLLCLFCQSPLTAEEDKEFKTGDLIKCNSCDELNDYDSLIEVAKEKGIKKVESQIQEELDKTMKGLFK